MRHKRVVPWTLRQRDRLQRIGSGVRWSDLAVLFAMPREAAQDRAGEALAGTAIDNASQAAQRAAGANG